MNSVVVVFYELKTVANGGLRRNTKPSLKDKNYTITGPSHASHSGVSFLGVLSKLRFTKIFSIHKVLHEIIRSFNSSKHVNPFHATGLF